MSDLVGKPEDRFSHDAAHMILFSLVAIAEQTGFSEFCEVFKFIRINRDISFKGWKKIEGSNMEKYCHKTLTKYPLYFACA